MWPIRPETDKSRGGFQNRDVGRSDFGKDFGPDYGTDFARFADPADPVADMRLLDLIETEVKEDFKGLDVLVRNGFVFVKGFVPDERSKSEVTRRIFSVTGVREVINQLRVVAPS